MKSEWKKVRIEEIGKIITGNTPPKKNKNYFGGTYPWVKPTDIKIGNRYVDKTEETYSELAFEKYEKSLLPPLSTCVVTIGTVGEKICLTKEHSFTNQSINAVIPTVDQYDPIYVYYLMKYNLPKVAKRNPGTASGRHHVSKSNFASIVVEVPPYDIQKRIAAILSVFDDLVEINERSIEILERLSTLVYAQWFVHRRYPRHNNEATSLREDWKKTSASDAIFIDPVIKVPMDTVKKYVPMSSLSTDSMIIENVQTKKGSSGSKFQNGDTLFARITPCLENGKTGYVQFLDANEVGIGSTEFIVLRSKSLTPEFVYCMARTDAFRQHAIKSMTGGSGRQRVQNECFSNFFLLQPPLWLLDKFSSMVSPMFREIQLLATKSKILKATRDLLLPKLISGEIDVGASHFDFVGD